MILRVLRRLAYVVSTPPAVREADRRSALAASLPPGAFLPVYGDSPLSWWRCDRGHETLDGLVEPTFECSKCLYSLSHEPGPTTWTRVTDALEARAAVEALGENPNRLEGLR